MAANGLAPCGKGHLVVRFCETLWGGGGGFFGGLRTVGQAKLLFVRKGGFQTNGFMHTVPLCKGKVFIGRSCPILVLTTVLSRPRRADVMNGVKNYQGPTNSRENAIQKYQNFPRAFF